MFTSLTHRMMFTHAVPCDPFKTNYEHMKKYILFIFLFISLSSYSIAQGNYTIDNGGWTEPSTWHLIGNNDVPGPTIGNQFNHNSLTITAGDTVNYTNASNPTTLEINKQNFILNIYGTLNLDHFKGKNSLTVNVYGELNMKSFDADNGVTFNVINSGIVNIEQNLDVDNNLTINVDEDAQFNVGGNIILKNGASLTINGSLSANIISGHPPSGSNTNEIDGSGILYIGEFINGIDYSGFTGIIVYGNTDFTVPPPYNLNGIEVSSPIRVYLDWEFNQETIPTDDVEFIGFQIFKNNNPDLPLYEYDLIVNYTYFDVDVTVNNFNDLFYWDEEGFLSGDQPKYYIRAAYQRLINQSIVFSTISEFNFLNQPLPIELLSFHASALNHAIGLYWSTAVEINNMGFEIQRLDLQIGNWVVIGWVDGNYNHNGVLSYSFTDFKPKEGVNYYRLRQIDYDGAYEFYGPVAAALDLPSGSFDLKIIRNHNQVFVIMPGNETGLLEVFDLTGKRISAQYASGSINMPMARGTYIIRFSGSHQIATAKVVL